LPKSPQHWRCFDKIGSSPDNMENMIHLYHFSGATRILGWWTPRRRIQKETPGGRYSPPDRWIPCSSNTQQRRERQRLATSRPWFLRTTTMRSSILKGSFPILGVGNREPGLGYGRRSVVPIWTGCGWLRAWEYTGTRVSLMVGLRRSYGSEGPALNRGSAIGPPARDSEA
jgi:hypothetical protein